MIEVVSLTRRYGSLAAVDQVSFGVDDGEVLGFLGPNGAGKTTTMRVLVGSLAPTSGEVRVAGVDVTKNSKEARRHIGYLPEAPPVYRQMTVRAYLDFAARIRGVSGRDRNAKVDRAIDRTALGDVSGRLIDHLSKGYRQRVGIAQALVHEPKLLILDEPTSGLDPAQVAEIRDLIGDLKGDHTIVLSTHILSEVRATCDRVLIINKGRRIAGPATEDQLREQLGAGRTIRLELARPGDEVIAALEAIDGVDAVTRVGDTRFDVTSTGTDPREAVNAAASAFGLLESRSAGGLEELYLRAVSAPAAKPDGDEEQVA
ncbi:MAG: ATP-binding cassette domain-containing protein [Proteobacteria bacterium]|nr:ATP-binding cassette domain-containing protein [Pseudomonadota bacterium]